MDGEVFVAAGQQRELPDQLLGELPGSVHVVAARGDDWQAVGRHIRLGNHLCARLGSRVGVCGLQRAVLRQACKQAHEGLKGSQD